mgnify:FL=1|tara:strand:+ start:406 stop:960 length:555 start_codon:yes stop_codon:yes gene_type:complete
MKIKKISLSEIKPYWRNARKNDKTVEVLKQSIKSYGFNQPLVLDKENVIITGHARYRALMQLGHTEAPCIVTDLSPQKAKEYRIADNKTHELTIWNNDDLMVELREIGNIEEMQTYFENISLNNWLDDSVGFNLNPVTYEDVEKKKGELENRYDYNEEENTKKFNTILCPHCLEEIEVNKNDFS